MALTARYNITTVLTQNLIAAGDNAGSIKSVNLANVHASTSVDVDLLVNRDGSDYYIIKNVTIPAKTSLVIDMSNISVISTTGGDSLRIKLSAAVPVDVIIS